MIDDEKPRADAREKRDHILEVVRDALAADPAAALNAIPSRLGSAQAPCIVTFRAAGLWCWASIASRLTRSSRWLRCC